MLLSNFNQNRSTILNKHFKALKACPKTTAILLPNSICQPRKPGYSVRKKAGQNFADENYRNRRGGLEFVFGYDGVCRRVLDAVRVPRDGWCVGSVLSDKSN
jgi:hypothetical protein